MTPLIAITAIGWGSLVLLVIRALAARGEARRRVRELGVADRGPRSWWWAVFERVPLVKVVVALMHKFVRGRQVRRDAERLARDLPIAVDLVGVAVAAGCTPYLAVSCASKWSPPSVAAWLDRVHASARFGGSFGDALESVGTSQPVLRGLCEVLETSNRLGSPAGAALTDLSARLRADVRRRAEARARSLSVRLVFPLVFLVLPAFALLTVAPAVISGLRAATA